MTTSVQRRRGSTAQHSTFTGLEGELTIDTSKDTAVIHDGSTVGGFPLAKEGLQNTNTTNLSPIVGTDTAADDTFLIYDTSASAMKKITRAELNNAIEVDALANVTITGGTINGTSLGATTASTGRFSTLEATGVATFSAGTVSAPAITTTGDTNTGIFFPAADTIAFTEGGVESMRITSAGAVLVGQTAANYNVEGISFTKDGYITACADEATANTNSVLYLNRRSSDGEMISFYRDGGQTGFIGTTATNNMTFATGATERMRINSAGQVGIGTTSPASILHTVAANSAGIFELTGSGGISLKRATAVGNNSALHGINFQNSDSTVGGLFAINATGGTTSTGTGYEIRTVAEGLGRLTFYTNSAERMRIDSAGNVLVGTTTNTNSSRFVINGTASETVSSIQYLVASQYDVGTAPNKIPLNQYLGTMAYQDSNAVNITGGIVDVSAGTAALPSLGTTGDENTGVFFPAADTIAASTNGVERMRIASDGNVIIGATNPFAKFDVAQSSNATNSGRTGYIRSSWSGDVSTSALTVSKFDNNSTTSQFFVAFEINNTATPCGRITANGANTAAFGSTSDERVKEKIVNLPSQLDNIMSLRPVEFNYIETYGGGHQIGFIAQEMQAVYPDVVSSDDSAEKILSITGWSKTEARLVKAIQEQQTLIENLTTRLNALEGK